LPSDHIGADEGVGTAVKLTKVIGLQPGLIRVTVTYDADVEPRFYLRPTCAPPTSADSVVPPPARGSSIAARSGCAGSPRWNDDQALRRSGDSRGGGEGLTGVSSSA
jgi:hypothetical protein